MNKLEFYTQLIQKHGITKEVLIELLSDIGKANEKQNYYGSNYVSFDDMGVTVTFEEYRGCGRWGTDTARIMWDDLVEKFLNSPG